MLELRKKREEGLEVFTEGRKDGQAELCFEVKTGGRKQLVGALPRLDQLHLAEKIIRTANNYAPEGHYGFTSRAVIKGMDLSYSPTNIIQISRVNL